ncbi:pentapeptide repeat-containing protein [Arenicellales bacterium nBUS_45]
MLDYLRANQFKIFIVSGGGIDFLVDFLHLETHDWGMNKIIPLILSTLLLTSCSGPDSSGGVEFSKTANAFPYGDCRGSGYQTHHTERTGCGWFMAHEKSYYIMPWADLIDEISGFTNLSYTNLGHANLNDAYLVDANLRNADLYGADLNGADLSGADLSNSYLSEANLSNAFLYGANLTHANLNGANLSNADLYGADLSGANLTGVQATSSTICPNGINWGTSGNDCPF